MAEKVVKLAQLSRFKTNADAEYKKYSNASLAGVKNVKGALDALAVKASADEVSLSEEATAQEGYAKSYKFQKGTGSPVYINIPKDMVVSSGQVVTNPSGQAAGTYIELTLANATNDKIYINATSLIEYVTSGSGTDDKVQVAVDAATHKVTASIKAGSIELADLASGVQTSIGSIDNKVDKVSGKGLSTNDFTDSDKAKLDGIEYATNDDIDALFSPENEESEAAEDQNG